MKVSAFPALKSLDRLLLPHKTNKEDAYEKVFIPLAGADDGFIP
jgi:hypothetical protein